MREDYTDIAIVLDESGSMQSTKSDAIGGFNQFLDDQKKLPGFATLTFVKFNTSYAFVHNGLPIINIPSLTAEEYWPAGGTALVDAICRTIEGMGKRLEAMDEDKRPSKVIVVIITDGEENSSTKFTRHQMNEMIKHQEEVYKWQFVFIGSNQDAIATAASYGIKAQSSLNMGVGGAALAAGYRAMSKSIGEVRLGVCDSMEFTDADRLLQQSLGAHPHDKKKNDNPRSGTNDSASWPTK